MPINLAAHAPLSARLSRLLLDAHRVGDELSALPLQDVEAEALLAPAATLAAVLLDSLQEAMSRAE